MGVYRKNEDCHLLRSSMLFVVVYFVFFVDAFFMEKIAKQNRLFSAFFQKSQNRQFCFAIFSMKNASTEKKYTMTKSTEKQIKCTSPIFNFRNFVTEIFAKHFQKFSIFWKNIKRRICCQNSRFCFMIFSMKNASTVKNKVHHDEEHGTTNKMVISNVKKKLTPASRWLKATSPPQELDIWERSDPNF